MAAFRVEDELAKAKALVDRAVKAEGKKQRKIFPDARRSEIMKARMAREKNEGELGKEVKAKVRALKKASGMFK